MIGIYSPGTAVAELVRHDERVEVISGPFGLFENERDLLAECFLPMSDGAADETCPTSIEHLVQEVRSWGPLWTRWVPRAGAHELDLRLIVNQAVVLAEDLKKKEIGVVLFHTSMSHHIDSMTVELACRISGIPQVFLYSVGIGYRLLPLVQNHGISDRHLLEVEISSHSYESELRQLADMRMQVPLLTPGVSLTDSFGWGCLRAVEMHARSRLAAVSRRTFLRQSVSLKSDLFPPWSIRDELGAMQRQRMALKELSALASPVESLRNVKSQPAVVVAAHLQPEGTSYPEGGNLANMIDLVIKIRQSGFREAIFYKEHPASGAYLFGNQFSRGGVARSREYYQQLISLGCVLLPLDATFNEVERQLGDIVPVTLTGSIAVERSLKGLGTVVAGFPWFRGMPGTLGFEVFANPHSLAEAATAREGVAVGSFDFLNLRLSRRTLTNVPGIGLGYPDKSRDAVANFEKEFTQLIGFLHATF